MLVVGSIVYDREMKKILVLSGNPNKQSFSHAMAEAYVKGAKNAGHSVKFVHVPSLNIDVNNTPKTGSTSVIDQQQKLIKWCEHMVVVSPVWFYYMPASLKGYFELILTPGFAFRFPHPWPLMSNFLPTRLLKGRTVRSITTQDSFRFISWLVGNPFLLSIPLSIYFFVGFFPIRHTAFHRVRYTTSSKREKWLARIERMGERAK